MNKVMTVSNPEPVVSIDDVKRHCRIDHDADNAQIENMIAAATEQANHLCGVEFGVNAPKAVKQWVLMRVGFMYENRTATLENGQGEVPVRHFVDGLLDPYLKHSP